MFYAFMIYVVNRSLT